MTVDEEFNRRQREYVEDLHERLKADEDAEYYEEFGEYPEWGEDE